MTSAFGVAIALLCVGQLPVASSTELPGGQQVEFSADRLLSEQNKVILSGHAVMRTEGAVLRADEIFYDQVQQVATAKGHVTLALTVNGLYAAVADQVSMKLKDGLVSDVYVDGGLVMKKSGVSPEQLLEADTQDKLKAIGQTSISLTGTHLKRVDDGGWEIDRLSFTPCDCDPKEPSWRVQSKRAYLDLEDQHAELLFPTVYVRSVPIFWLPWLYLPLNERRSGLLVPRPNFQAQNGFTMDVPFFVTLGDSYDLTLTPGYYSGAARPLPGNGVKGPRLHTEFRYTPTARMNGRATLGLLYDLREPRNPFNLFGPGRPDTDVSRADRLANALAPQRIRGLRSEGSLQHSHDMGRGWFNRVDASYVSDGYYVSDLAADILAREAAYLRSTAQVYHRADWHWAGLDIGMRQDLSYGTSIFGEVARGPNGYLRHGPNPLHRLPAVTFDVPEQIIAGALRGSVRATFTRLSTSNGLTGDEGTLANEGRATVQTAEGPIQLPYYCLSQLLYSPNPPWASLCPPGTPIAGEGGTEGDRVYQPGEREPRNRLDLRPRLSTSIPASRFATVAPYLAYRQSFYFGELSGRAEQRGYPMMGLTVDSELSRNFRNDTLRHVVTPSTELRYVPFVLGSQPAPYDEVDAAIGENRRLLQMVAEVRQKLLWKRPGGPEFLRLDLGQELNLLAPTPRQRVADTYARINVSQWPATFWTTVRFDTGRDRKGEPITGLVNQLSAGFQLDNGKAGLWASYDNLFNEGSYRTRQGLDELVGPPALNYLVEHAEQLTGGVRLSLKSGWGFRYEMLVPRQRIEGAQPANPAAVLGDPDGETPSRLIPLQHALSVSYGPACDCWRVEAHAIQGISQKSGLRTVPTFGATLTISRFGSFGAGG